MDRVRVLHWRKPRSSTRSLRSASSNVLSTSPSAFVNVHHNPVPRSRPLYARTFCAISQQYAMAQHLRPSHSIRVRFPLSSRLCLRKPCVAKCPARMVIGLNRPRRRSGIKPSRTTGRTYSTMYRILREAQCELQGTMGDLTFQGTSSRYRDRM